MRSTDSGANRRHHPLTWTVVALHLVAAVVFSLLLPMFRTPDEARHVDLIRRYRVGLGHERPDRTVPLGEDVRQASLVVDRENVRPRPPLDARHAVPRPDRPSFADLAAPGEPSGAVNHMTQHPPLYYAVTASAATFIGGLTPSGLWSWDREMYLYRILSILLTAPLPLLAAEAALALRLSRRASAVAAAALLLVPQATAIGAGVNNDALVMLASAAAVVAALWHLRTATAPTALLAVGAGAVAALSKATAAPLLAWVVLTLVARWFVGRRERPAGPATDPGARRVPAMLGAAAITAVGSSWYVRNLIRFKDPQPTGLRPLRQNTEFEPSAFGFLHPWLDRLSRTFWGMPARRTGVALPWFLPHLMSIGAVVLSLAAWGDRARRRSTTLLWVLCGVQVALLLRSNWGSHSRSGAFPAVQGRYLYALLVPVAVLCVVGARHLAGLWGAGSRRPSTLLVGLCVTALGMVLHLLLGLSMLEGFWGAPEASMWDRVAAVRAWSPLPAVVTTVALGALVLGTAAASAAVPLRAVRELRAPRVVTGPDRVSPETDPAVAHVAGSDER